MINSGGPFLRLEACDACRRLLKRRATIHNLKVAGKWREDCAAISEPESYQALALVCKTGCVNPQRIVEDDALTAMTKRHMEEIISWERRVRALFG